MVNFKKLGESIRRNKAIREKAAELKSLVDSEISELDDKGRSRFWDELFSLVVGRSGSQAKEAEDALSYDDARVWARATRMPFGKHQGEQVLDVPPSYFEWLEQQPDFRRQLGRYLRSSYYRDVHAKGNDTDV